MQEKNFTAAEMVAAQKQAMNDFIKKYEAEHEGEYLSLAATKFFQELQTHAISADDLEVTFNVLMHNNRFVSTSELTNGFIYIESPYLFPPDWTKETLITTVEKEWTRPRLPGVFENLFGDNIKPVMDEQSEKKFNRFKRNLDQCDFVEVQLFKIGSEAGESGSVTFRATPLHVENF